MGAMSPSDEPSFRYPSDPARRLGFVVGDIIPACVVILILSAVIKV